MVRNKKSRADCALGFHFDLHANLIDYFGEFKNLGEKFDPAAVEEFMAKVKPDYVQCDTKGHPGVASYPTKIGTPGDLMPGVDILKAWREITAKYGVRLYAHHSGIYENMAVEKHPDWSACDPDGKPYALNNTSQFSTYSEKMIYPPDRYVSTFSPYVDELLIPQLTEIAKEYELDGCWVDGDCWAVQIDYSKWAIEAYFKKTGKQPPHKGDTNYLDYLAFLRDGFKDYVHHYASELHKTVPGFEVCSSWMYTHMMPEKPDDELDFISGDNANFSLASERYIARCLACHDKPWDIMTWSHSPGWRYGVYRTFDTQNRDAEQICQDAAIICALGGGFEYLHVQKNGGVDRWMIDRAVKVAKFIREREKFCFRAKPIRQVAILFSTKAFYSSTDENRVIYGDEKYKVGANVRSTLEATLDNQYATEILVSYLALERNLSDYGLIIVPELPLIEPEVKEKLLAYTKNGGSLIVLGINATKIFEEALGVEILKTSDDVYCVFAEEKSGFLASTYSYYNTIKPKTAIPLSKMVFSSDSREKGEIAATVTDYGKGRLLGVYFDYAYYVTKKTPALRRWFGELLQLMYPDPLFKIKGSHLVEASLMQKNGKINLNLVNLAGAHSSALDAAFDEIPPLYGLYVEIKSHNAPKEVYIEPGHIETDFIYKDGSIRLTVPKLEIHSVITIG